MFKTNSLTGTEAHIMVSLCLIIAAKQLKAKKANLI